MKTILLCVLGLFITLNANAVGGTVGNGGDGMAIEFSAISLALPGIIEKWPEHVNFINLETIRKTAQNFHVDSEDRIFLDEIEKDAINYPSEKRVVINRSRWKDLSLKNKYALTLHELMGLGEIFDDEYKVTKRFLAFLNSIDDEWAILPAGWVTVCDRSEKIKKYLEKRFDDSCEFISPIMLATVKNIEIREEDAPPGFAIEPDRSTIELRRQDLSGLPNLKKFSLDGNSRPIRIPEGFFILNHRLEEIFIKANQPDAVQLQGPIFNDSIRYKLVSIGDTILTHRVSCTSSSFSGLKTEILKIKGLDCEIGKNLDVKQLSLLFWRVLPKDFWINLQPGISRLSVGVLNLKTSVPFSLPVVPMPVFEKIESLELGYVVLAPNQFAAMTALKSLTIGSIFAAGPHVFIGAKIESLHLVSFNCNTELATLDPNFFKPLVGLKKLSLGYVTGLEAAVLNRFNFSSQDSVVELEINGGDSSDVLSKYFQNVKYLRTISKHNAPSLISHLAEIEVLEMDTFNWSSQMKYMPLLDKNKNLKTLIFPDWYSEENKRSILKNYGAQYEVVFKSFR